jgi:hypothetical protein
MRFVVVFSVKKITDDLHTLKTKSTAELHNHWLFSSAFSCQQQNIKSADVGESSSYQAMYSVYRRVTNSLTIPSAFSPIFPPLLYSVQIISREMQPTMLPAKDELNECVRSSHYCVPPCGIYIASPTDSTWQGTLRTRGKVGGVAQRT